MTKFLLIGLGGTLGTLARYLVSLSFPNSTLMVNLIGSFLICFVMSLALSTELISPTTRLVLVVGVFGGFTTYSSFSYETILLLQQGQALKALTSVLVMTGGCLIAAWLGQQVAQAFRVFILP